jgi:hypothetical protein
MLTSRNVGRRKRGGPCTDEGKARTRLNALKHGLASCNSHDQLYFESTKKVAAAICGGQDDPLLFEQALVIAECDQLLRRIHLEQLGALERLEDCLVKAVAGSYAKDASRDLEKFQVYERRAWSRRTRAIQTLITIKTLRASNGILSPRAERELCRGKAKPRKVAPRRSASDP